MKKRLASGYDILGNIAILKFPDNTKLKEKKETAKQVLELSKTITTVLEKLEKVKGRLRTIKTRVLAGKNTKEALHRENACNFKLNVEECYFSPRLSNERLELAKEIKKKDSVLVMFAGVSPYSIIIAKFAKPKKVTSIELGKQCCKYAKENVKLNKLNNLEILQGDVKRICPKLKKKKIKYYNIVMARPQLKDTFIKEALMLAKKGTIIYYYGFADHATDIFQNIKKDIEKVKRKVEIFNVKKAGNISPYKYRWRVDLKVLN